MNTVKLPAELARELVSLGADASMLSEKVAADISAVEAKAPTVADILIDSGLVDGLYKESTEKLLMDHSAVLDVVARLAKQASAPRSMGQPAATPSVSYDPQNPPEKESERIFREKLTSLSL